MAGKYLFTWNRHIWIQREMAVTSRISIGPTLFFPTMYENCNHWDLVSLYLLWSDKIFEPLIIWSIFYKAILYIYQPSALFRFSGCQIFWIEYWSVSLSMCLLMNITVHLLQLEVDDFAWEQHKWAILVECESVEWMLFCLVYRPT